MEEYHTPVLLNESIKYLITNRDGYYFDGTLGFGGHSSEILKNSSGNSKLIATEIDESAYNFSKKKFAGEKRIKIYKANFSEIDNISKIEFIDGYDGIFADLGVSSFQLDNVESGFTYRKESFLDLRLDKKTSITAADIVNSFSEEDLADIFFQFGEERNSRKIAKNIVENRTEKKIKTTTDLAFLIEEVVPKQFLNKTLSRVFQSLRIYINNELDVLKEFLSKSVELLKTDGRIVVLTYHSLEDRIVKEFFKFESSSCVCPPEFPVCVCDKKKRLEILTKKPVVATEDEIKKNLRSRSAKLRAGQKI
jgi:16S rRNA (cytosine1402-N4)-methyltransferase